MKMIREVGLNGIVSTKGRFKNAIYNKIFKSGLKIENSKDISPRIQQSLLHWSYIVNNEDYERWKLEKQK